MTKTMLDAIAPFDPALRVRELELSISRRIRGTIQPFVGDPEVLEAVTRELLDISRDFAGSFEAIAKRVRLQRETATE